MNYSDFYEMMQKCGAVSGEWRNVLKLLACSYGNPDMDVYLKILVLYFSLIDDGNVYMALDKSTIDKKFGIKIGGLKIQAKDEDHNDALPFEDTLFEISNISSCLTDISSFDAVSTDGKDGLFVVSDGKLYTRKHYNAVQKIKTSVSRLFKSNPPAAYSFDYKKIVGSDFTLSTGQEDVIKKGIHNNLLVTGGPGTGKTTSVFFLLMALLDKDHDYNIYLTAPSGKAASRMKDSILQSASLITSTGKWDSAIEKIKTLEEYTIHRLLVYNPKANSFKYNAGTKFPDKSIFVIDEASMIDVNIFASLLEAIPDTARVFFLGDKNQLPSVECGAVFGGLLADKSLCDNIVTLTESKRFDSSSEIYQLAETINGDSGDLSYIENEWKDSATFEIGQNKTSETPIFYYRDDQYNDSEVIETVVSKWYENFCGLSNLQKKCTEIIVPTENGNSASLADFDAIWKIAEDSRILCACNKSSRGIQTVNKIILKKYYADKKSISGFYPGELLMVTKNNKVLDLYNGDCGVTVQFCGDDTLYFMLKKGTKLKLDGNKVENKIFRLGDYLFYPIRFISSDDIEPAFAITVHKSQGSDYNHILVFLPSSEDHPLLNRQIVYTAITRAKKSVYIFSDQKNMECARKTVLTRDTF